MSDEKRVNAPEYRALRRSVLRETDDGRLVLGEPEPLEQAENESERE